MQKRDKMPLIYVYGYSCLVYLVYLLHDWTILSLLHDHLFSFTRSISLAHFGL